MSKRSKELWVIEFSSPDPSSESTNAYHSREEAVEHACRWIKYTAKQELDGIEWSDDEAPKLLREALAAIEEGRQDDAILSWLEFQQEYDPDEQISIGPSGEVSPLPGDFR